MSSTQRSKTNVQQMIQQQPKEYLENLEVNNNSESDSTIEAPKEKLKKPISEKKLESIRNAQKIRMAKIKEENERKQTQKQMIEKIYEKQVEEKLQREFVPKYEKRLEKKILNRLKEEKLKQLMTKYNIQPQDSNQEYEEESDTSDSEEEVIIKKKVVKKKTNKGGGSQPQPPATISRPVTAPQPRPSINQLYAQYGF